MEKRVYVHIIQLPYVYVMYITSLKEKMARKGSFRTKVDNIFVLGDRMVDGDDGGDGGCGG